MREITNNKSLKIYHNLCNKHKSKESDWTPVGSLLFRHRIIPGHQGGDYSKENCTYLTHRQHVVAHYLRWRVYKDIGDRIAYRGLSKMKSLPPMLDRKHSKESRNKMSKSHKRLKQDHSYRLKMSNATREFLSTPKNKEEMVKRLTASRNTKHARKNISDGQKRRFKNPAERLAHQARLKEAWARPESRRKASESAKKRFADPEARRRHSAIVKLGWARKKAKSALDDINKPGQLVLVKVSYEN